jgi:excisionase family DNA binding protein
MSDWLTVDEATKLSGYHEDHIRRLVRSGEVKARKVVIVWLVSRKSLIAYLRRQEQRGERRGAKPH